MTWSRITISARAAMPFSRPTSFERLARNFESFRKPRTGLPILFLCASLNRNEGRHEGVVTWQAHEQQGESRRIEACQPEVMCQLQMRGVMRAAPRRPKAGRPG